MTAERGLMAGIVFVALANVGCVSCSPPACQRLSLSAGPACDTPQTGRGKVHVYLVDGLPVPFTCGLDGLRPELYARGFSKVASGNLLHTTWMAKEMKRTHADDPAARFVVVGYDHGSGAAVRLASDAASFGVPVDAVVLLDPSGSDAAKGGAARTVVIHSRGGKDAVPYAESSGVPASHFGLPCHEQTAAKVCEVLNESATRAWMGQPRPTEVIGWDYEHAPPANALPAAGIAAPTGWDFLNERPWGGSAPMAPVAGPEPRRTWPVSR